MIHREVQLFKLSGFSQCPLRMFSECYGEGGKGNVFQRKTIEGEAKSLMRFIGEKGKVL